MACVGSQLGRIMIGSGTADESDAVTALRHRIAQSLAGIANQPMPDDAPIDNEALAYLDRWYVATQKREAFSPRHYQRMRNTRLGRQRLTKAAHELLMGQVMVLGHQLGWSPETINAALTTMRRTGLLPTDGSEQALHNALAMGSVLRWETIKDDADAVMAAVPFLPASALTTAMAIVIRDPTSDLNDLAVQLCKHAHVGPEHIEEIVKEAAYVADPERQRDILTSVGSLAPLPTLGTLVAAVFEPAHGEQLLAAIAPRLSEAQRAAFRAAHVSAAKARVARGDLAALQECDDPPADEVAHAWWAYEALRQAAEQAREQLHAALKP